MMVNLRILGIFSKIDKLENIPLNHFCFSFWQSKYCQSCMRKPALYKQMMGVYFHFVAV